MREGGGVFVVQIADASVIGFNDKLEIVPKANAAPSAGIVL